jgi:hypothetical protein
LPEIDKEKYELAAMAHFVNLLTMADQRFLFQAIFL